MEDIGQLRMVLEQLRQRQAEQAAELERECGRRQALELTLLEKHDALKVSLAAVDFSCSNQLDALRKRNEELHGVVTGKHRVRLGDLHRDLEETRFLFEEFREETVGSVSQLNDLCKSHQNEVIKLRQEIFRLEEQQPSESNAVRRLQDSISEIQSEHTESYLIAAIADNEVASLDRNANDTAVTLCRKIHIDQYNLRTFVEESERAMQKAVLNCVSLVESQAEDMQSQLHSRLEELRSELQSAFKRPSLDMSVATLLPSPSPLKPSPKQFKVPVSPIGKMADIAEAVASEGSSVTCAPGNSVVATLESLTPTRPAMHMFEGPDLRGVCIPPAPKAASSGMASNAGSAHYNVASKGAGKGPQASHKLLEQKPLGPASSFSIHSPSQWAGPPASAGQSPGIRRSASWSGLSQFSGPPQWQPAASSPTSPHMQQTPRGTHWHYVVPGNGLRPPSPW